MFTLIRSMKKLSPMMIGLGLALAVPAVAHADRKVYAGTTCVKDSSTGALLLDSGSAFNSATTGPMVVNCPIVRDNPTAALLSAQVQVRDFHNGEQVECTLISRTALGGLFAQSPTQSSGNSFAAGAAALNYSSLAESDNGFYYLRCTIPAKLSAAASASGIVSYRIDEPGTE